MPEDTCHLSPTRLILARHLRGLTKVELAGKAQITRQSLSGYEAGNRLPSPEILGRLSTALSIPPTFLSAGEVDPPAAASISFRSLARLPARTRDQACATAVIAVQAAEWIDRQFELPTPNVPDWELVQPEAAADSLRRKWALGSRPIPHLVHLLESKGVRVFSIAQIAGRWRGLDALSFWYGGTPFILINTTTQRSRLRMSLAHELGHLVLHQGDGLVDRRAAEHQATQFASALLLPRVRMTACGVRLPQIGALTRLKRTWGASMAALIRRLYEVGMLSQWQYRAGFVEISTRGWRLQEPPASEAGIPLESSKLLHKVLAALRAEGVPPSAIARELHLYDDDLNALLVGLVPTVVPESPQSSSVAGRERRAGPNRDRISQ